MPTLAVVYYSSQGHTHALAEAVAGGARGVPGTAVDLHRLQDADIQNGRWKNDAVLTALAAADAIVSARRPTWAGTARR
jgi:NAD(P)H dehydrogenase (quinone)